MKAIAAADRNWAIGNKEVFFATYPVTLNISKRKP